MVFPPFTCTLLPAFKLSGRRDIRPLGPTPTQSRIPLRGLMKLRFARDIGPRTPTLGPILFRLRLDEIGALQFSFRKPSGRRDFAPYTTPAQSHYPLRGLMDFWRPREFRFIQELCPMEPVR